MCKSSGFIIALLFSLTLAAQNERDSIVWGSIEKSDLELADCDFDKNAEALVLHDGGKLVSTDLRPMEFTRHIRIKILTDKGLDWANVKIPFLKYASSENIKELEAQTFNLDAAGNIVTTKVDDSLIYEKPVNKRVSEKIFAFPHVKTGSVIEYRYTMVGVNMGNWYFQKIIPVRFSSYTADIPSDYETSVRPIVAQPYEFTKDSTDTRVVYSFVMRNIPSLREEPFTMCREDYLQRIESRIVALNGLTGRIDYTRTWSDIISRLMGDEDFGLQLNKEIRRTSDLDDMLKLISTQFAKMCIIHQYVKEKMRWNGYDNIWALEGVKSAWKDKKGTTGEINLILVNLLKDAGLDAEPVLVSTHQNGQINQLLPGTRQFNKVVAYVKINEPGREKMYVLDGTDKLTPSYLIPQDIMYSLGLILSKPAKKEYHWEWKNLWNEKRGFKNMVILNGEIDENGDMKGTASVNSFDYSRVNKITDAKKEPALFLEKYFSAAGAGVKVDSLTIVNADIDSLPLVQNFQFAETLASSGDYKYFSVNKFCGLEKNPFLSDSRLTDVFFGAIRGYTIVGNFSIPDNYSFEGLPKNMRMILPDTSISFTRMSAVSGNQLSVKITLEFKKPFYRTDEYGDFKEFYKKLFDILNEQFVLRKKS